MNTSNELQKTLQSRLDAKLISSCAILRICISYRPKTENNFKPEGEYMLHSWGDEGGQMDIFWGHYDLTVKQALDIWNAKLIQQVKWFK
jgi:hypothetical protein